MKNLTQRLTHSGHSLQNQSTFMPIFKKGGEASSLPPQLRAWTVGSFAWLQVVTSDCKFL